MSPVIYMLEKELIEHKLVTRLPIFLGIFAVVMFALLMSGDNSHFYFQISGDYTWTGLAGVTGFAGIIGKVNVIVAGMVSVLSFFAYMPKTLRKERQEGSLMFWRSMPVTDQLAIAVKLIFALIVIPCIASLLLLFSDLIVWLLGSWLLPVDMQASASMSLLAMVSHWFEFLGRMIFVSLALLPIACLLLVLSQITRHPLISLFVAVLMINLLTYMVFGSSRVGDFLSDIYHLPFNILVGDSPVTDFFSLGPITLIALLLASGGLFYLSAQLRGSDDIAERFGMSR